MPKKKQELQLRDTLQTISESKRIMMRLNKGRPLNQWEIFIDDIKVGTKVIWYEWIYMVSLIIAYIIYFIVLIWMLPYLFDWFFSFP